jgi:hypothetical protein
MSSTPTKPRRSRRARSPSPENDRRAPASAKGLDVTLRRLKGALGRPLSLRNIDGRLHIVLVDRRSAPREAPPSVDQIRADLRTRLVVQPNEQAVRVLHPLVQVHDELSSAGWEGVGKLPDTVICKALEQALMLQQDDPSAALGLVIGRLRLFKAAAEVEADRQMPASQSVF